jgi:hypothetical protein
MPNSWQNNERFQSSLPVDYLIASNRGLLDPCRGIPHSIYHWLTPPEIEAFDWPPWKSPALVPFASEPSTSCLCWSLDHGPGWVFVSPVDDFDCRGYATNFSGALFRAVLEDLASSSVPANLEIEPSHYAAMLKSFLPTIRDLWKPEWSNFLQDVLSRPPVLNHVGLVAFLSSRELNKFISGHLNFPMLDQFVTQRREGT